MSIFGRGTVQTERLAVRPLLVENSGTDPGPTFAGPLFFFMKSPIKGQKFMETFSLQRKRSPNFSDHLSTEKMSHDQKLFSLQGGPKTTF